METPFRAGRVAVLGRPNVGKSTLVNALVGSKVSIVSHRAQTTRHRLLGIATFEHGQLLLLDTPGIHREKGAAINRTLNRAARGALGEVDAALLVIEAGRWTEEDELAWQAAREAGVPCLLAINKIDRLRDKSALLPFIAKTTAQRAFLSVHPISALKASGLDALATDLLSLMPESAPLHNEDEITDRSERFLAAELIREQLLNRLGDELPYASAVEIESFEDVDGLANISAVIWVEREGQKPIVIGRGGERMKGIGQGAREQMEAMFGRKVFLKLWCKVRQGWADDEAALRRFGYGDG